MSNEATETNQSQGTNPWSDAPAPSYDLGGGGGGGSANTVDVTTTPPPPAKTTTPAAPSAPAQTAPVTPPTPVLDKDTIAELGRTIAQSVKPQDKPPEMSMEEFKRTFNVYDVNPEDVQKLGLSAEAAPVLQSMMQAVARQAVTMATYQINLARQQMEAKLNEGLTPLQQHYKQQREQVLKDRFMTAYPQLKGMESVLQLVYTQMKTEGFTAKSETEAFQAVAERANALIKTLPGMSAPQPQPGAKPAPTSKTTKMSTLTGGGQGGAGAAAGKGQQQSTAQYLFG